MMRKRILASLHLIDYEFVSFIVLEKFVSVKLHDMRTLADPHYPYFSDGFCFTGAQR